MKSRIWKITTGLALGALVAVAPAVTPQAGAVSTYQSAPFATQGVIQSVQMAPTGGVASFVLGSLSNTSGNIAPGEDSNGNITVDTDPSSVYYSCNTQTNTCAKSTDTAVIVQGDLVYITGHYFAETSQYQFVLSYAFNPPVAPPASSPTSTPQNPQPSSLSDYTDSSLFFVTGQTTSPGTYLLEGQLWSQDWGFTMGNFTDYGCGTASTCRVKQIALAHGATWDPTTSQWVGGHLLIDQDPINTTMWLSSDGGCTYAKTTDRYSTVNWVGSQQSLYVNGHYTWDGTDWRFLATNIFAPAPSTSCPSSGPSYGPLSAGGVVVENPPNQPASAASCTAATPCPITYTGQMGPSGPFSNGPTTMTLNWSYDPTATNCGGTQVSNGCWSFTGNWTVAAQSPSTTELAGTLSGTSTAAQAPPSPPTGVAEATVTVTCGRGGYAGYSGSGTWNADTTTDTSGSAPYPAPYNLDGTYHWSIAWTQSASC
ncbi:MAG TPA: hypothetical protein VFA11_11530 [Acidimicrobiales bacterium]|nr:hypothetical protein [Acidimicrobiales bacterium]